MTSILNQIDLDNINLAINQGGKVWENPCLKEVKRKIKDFYLIDDIPKCCYCSRLFLGEFRMVIDIEHILPQSHFQTERFNMLNLNIACKRCNMEIKKSDKSFIVNELLMGTNYYNSSHYKFIHPNLDIYTDHLIFKEIRNGNSILIKYIIKDNFKGSFTYDYFKLKELEIDNINKAQGIKTTAILSNLMSFNLKKQILKILTKL